MAKDAVYPTKSEIVELKKIGKQKQNQNSSRVTFDSRPQRKNRPMTAIPYVEAKKKQKTQESEEFDC